MTGALTLPGSCSLGRRGLSCCCDCGWSCNCCICCCWFTSGDGGGRCDASGWTLFSNVDMYLAALPLAKRGDPKLTWRTWAKPPPPPPPAKAPPAPSPLLYLPSSPDPPSFPSPPHPHGMPLSTGRTNSTAMSVASAPPKETSKNKKQNMRKDVIGIQCHSDNDK